MLAGSAGGPGSRESWENMEEGTMACSGVCVVCAWCVVVGGGVQRIPGVDRFTCSAQHSHREQPSKGNASMAAIQISTRVRACLCMSATDMTC